METLSMKDLTFVKGLQMSVLKETKDDQLLAQKDCYVLVPSRFINKGLMYIDDVTKVLACYALVSGSKYTISNIPGYIQLAPYTITDVMIDGVVYKKLHFKKDSVFCPDINMVQTEDFMFNYIQELLINGKVPVYLTYEDLSNILAQSKKYAGSNIGKNAVVMELVASVIGRDPKDKTKQIRHIIKTSTDKNLPISWVPLLSVFYTFANTTNKLIGSYMKDGTVAALVNPSNSVENVERLLRS